MTIPIELLLAALMAGLGIAIYCSAYAVREVLRAKKLKHTDWRVWYNPIEDRWYAEKGSWQVSTVDKDDLQEAMHIVDYSRA